MRRSLVLTCLVATSACLEEAPAPKALTTFDVRVLGVFERNGATRTPLGVVASCVALYGSAAMVPADVKGQKGCRYIIPRGEVEFDLAATAMGIDGKPYRDFNNAVSFRVIPGDLPADLQARWATSNLGEVTATVRALHPYGEVHLWVEDAPPKLVFDAGQVPTEQLPAEVQPRTYAAGSSPTVYFADQTLQSLQAPSEFDNRSSPFAGEFVVVGKNPTSGETLKQTCADDPSRNGRDALMVVTGLDPQGFFVTDISACRLKEQASDRLGNTTRTMEPPETCWLTNTDGGLTENLDGGPGTCLIAQKSCRKAADCQPYLPGTFASMFVYNYNFPDGLDEGDLLFTLSGAIQEFTSTTQMVFPAWSTAERVRRLPPEQWNKWLQYAKPYDLNARTCGQDNQAAPFLTDALCGHNRRNMKMESLESALVRLRRVRFPKKFVNCDFDANGSVPFFCENPTGAWHWDTCADVEPAADALERTCNQDCVIGLNDSAGTICSERATFQGFGQYVVEMTLPGPSKLGLDDALPARVQKVVAAKALPTNPSVRAGGYAGGTEVALSCDQPARYRVGGDAVSAVDATDVLAANTALRVTLGAMDTSVAFQAVNDAANCTVGINARTRINLITKDAIPELNPDCDENSANAELAKQCRNLRGAEFDVIGHMRHVQPARPRWTVIPRAPDDVCCYPGPGLECPRPIRPCE